MELIGGTKLQSNKYKILSKIAQGNFGITYLVEQTSLERQVCIKEFFFRGSCERSAGGHVTITTSGRDITESFRRKFLREARRLSQFDHPNIVKVIDVFEENGTAYMVMDYIEGETLQQLVERRGKLTESEAIGYILPICDALEVVHQKGLLHLDIKPSNIIVKNGTHQPILIDFGVSKFTDESGHGHTTTTPVALTKGYAPLEQYGQDIKHLTTASDVYAVAATLYKLVTGVTPPEPSVILMNGIKSPSEITPALSKQLNNIIVKSLSLKAIEREASITKLRESLSLIIDSSAVQQEDNPTVIIETNTEKDGEKGAPVQNRNSFDKVIITVFVFVVFAILLALYFKNTSDSEESAQQTVIQPQETTERISENDAINNQVTTNKELPRSNEVDFQNLKFYTYCNARFNYCVEYPKDLLFEQGEAINGDGVIFKAKDGVERLRVYGKLNFDLSTLERRYLSDVFDEYVYEYSKGNSVITYKIVTKNHLVISGYRGSKIFYMKVIECKDYGGGDSFAFAIMEYDEKERELYDKIAIRVFKSLNGSY